VEHLEAEAAARGLNHIYNIVPVAHPDARDHELALLPRLP